MKTFACRKHCQGLTLVELMISIVLSLLIMAAAISIFLSSKQSFRLEESLSAVQENQRFITDLFMKDFSMVGHVGCALPYKDNNPVFQNKISGTTYQEVINGEEGASGAPDAITISYATLGSGIPVIPRGSGNPADPLPVAESLPLFQALQANFDEASPVPVVLAVGNCDHVDIFVATSATTDEEDPGVGFIGHAQGVSVGGLSNTDENFSEGYASNRLSTARVFQVQTIKYEIYTDANGVTGLGVTRGNGNREMLISGVTDLQISYGIDSPTDPHAGNADRYVNWSNSILVADITSIHFVITMDTEDGFEKTYDFMVKLRDMGLDV